MLMTLHLPMKLKELLLSEIILLKLTMAEIHGNTDMFRQNRLPQFPL